MAHLRLLRGAKGIICLITHFEDPKILRGELPEGYRRFVCTETLLASPEEFVLLLGSNEPRPIGLKFRVWDPKPGGLNVHLLLRREDFVEGFTLHGIEENLLNNDTLPKQSASSLNRLEVPITGH